MEMPYHLLNGMLPQPGVTSYDPSQGPSDNSALPVAYPTMHLMQHPPTSALPAPAPVYRPQEAPTEMKECPHPDCSVRTRYMELHLEHIHTRKFWGFQCLDPGCPYVFNAVHARLLRQHWEQDHSRRYIDDGELNAFKVKILEGYFDLVKCDLCNFRDFNEDRILQHKDTEHAALARKRPQPGYEDRFAKRTRREQYGTSYESEPRDSRNSYGHDDPVQRSDARGRPANHNSFSRPRQEARKKYMSSRGSERSRAADRNQSAPQKNKNPKKAQTCEHCGKEVLNKRLHVKRLHVLKHSGYCCPECLFETSEMDPRMFRNHRERYHGIQREEDLQRFLIEVPQGYYGMHQCGNCQFMALTEERIAKHPCQPENEIYDYCAGNKTMKSETANKPAVTTTTTNATTTTPKVASTKPKATTTTPNYRYRKIQPNNPPTVTPEHQRCPDEGCGVAVQSLKKHRKRWHTLKYTGIECDRCGTQSSNLDKGHVRHHMATEHGADIETLDISSLLVHVPEGYYDLYQCDNCSFRGFREEYVKKHACLPKKPSTGNGSPETSDE